MNKAFSVVEKDKCSFADNNNNDKIRLTKLTAVI